MLKYVITVALTGIILHAAAQNPLPDFSVDSLGKSRTRISWVNPFGAAIIQINVQSSYDSIKNFRTFFTPTSPQLPQNGIVDSRPAGKIYYRIFYAFAGGTYTFTQSKVAGSGAAMQTDQPNTNIVTEPPVNYNIASKYVVVNQHGYPEIKLPDAATKKYKLIFFDENHNQLFIINKITDTDLVLDKTNFLHAGVFYFELYNGDKLVEKNRIQIQKEF